MGLIIDVAPIMKDSKSSTPHLRVRRTKTAAGLACFVFVVAVGLSPGAGSSLGMPWWMFFCTWGLMSFFSVRTIVGFFDCKDRRSEIGLFYLIAPLSLLIALLVVWNRSALVQALR